MKKQKRERQRKRERENRKNYDCPNCNFPKKLLNKTVKNVLDSCHKSNNGEKNCPKIKDPLLYKKT